MLRILCLLLMIAVPVSAEDFIHVELVGVHDGDTIIVNLPDLPVVFGRHLSVRLHGIDAPEIKGRCERESTQALVSRSALKTMLQRGHIELRNVRRDKYFRVDATVFVDGRDVNAFMLKQGYARAYDGSARQGWCP